jgi:peptide/nickel transport system substrate-binding protein
MRQLLKIIAVAFLLGVSAQAQELRIGSRNEPAVDPHYLWLGTNTAYSKHIFEALILKDENNTLLPGLATEWKLVDDLHWEFKLRQGVKFHDGSPFTAEDVKFSYERVRNLPNNPGSYASNISANEKIEIVDPYTIRFKTFEPAATLPGLLGIVMIVSHTAAANALPPDFRSGRAAVGTGPFKFVEFRPGESLKVTRNEDYWGQKPAWERVTFRIIPNDNARVLALLSGDVDMAEHIAISNAVQIAANPDFHLYKRVSDRSVYLSLDAGRDHAPFLTDKAGAPLATNPLKDVRVRRAISKSINRTLIAERLMEGYAQPATQLAPEGATGFNPDIPLEAFDLPGARKLLAEAGWPDGFGMTIHCTNDRVINDAKICETLGQMISRLGLAVKVETMPASMFFTRAKLPEPEFSVMLLSWGHSDTTDISPLLTTIIHSYDRDRAMGTSNRGLYSDKDVDAKIEAASRILEPEPRAAAIRGVMALLDTTIPAVPLHTQYIILATRKGIDYRLRRDEQTLAMGATPARP